MGAATVTGRRATNAASCRRTATRGTFRNNKKAARTSFLSLVISDLLLCQVENSRASGPVRNLTGRHFSGPINLPPPCVRATRSNVVRRITHVPCAAAASAEPRLRYPPRRDVSRGGGEWLRRRVIGAASQCGNPSYRGAAGTTLSSQRSTIGPDAQAASRVRLRRRATKPIKPRPASIIA